MSASRAHEHLSNSPEVAAVPSRRSNTEQPPHSEESHAFNTAQRDQQDAATKTKQ